MFTAHERTRGLPIGNQTSQFLANVLLDPLDHFIKEKLRIRGYVRYADDLLPFSDDKQELEDGRDAIREFLAGFRLKLHPRNSEVFPVTEGIRFLGYRVFPTHRLVDKANILRFRRRLRRLQGAYAAGRVTAPELRARLISWTGHASHANSYRLVRRLVSEYKFVRPGKRAEKNGRRRPRPTRRLVRRRSPARRPITLIRPVLPRSRPCPRGHLRSRSVEGHAHLSRNTHWHTNLYAHPYRDINVFYDPHRNRDFDSHANQLTANQQDYAALGAALAAFATDLGSLIDSVAVMVVTEFGRTAAQNGTLGTDHGSGHCALLLGGRVRGGRVLGRWPGLGRGQLHEERDLAATTDYRDLFAEVARVQLGVAENLFPGYTPGPGPGALA